MSGGGKGQSNQTVAYYYAPVAFAICEGPIVGIKQIWAGGNLIFSDSQPVAVNTYQGGGKKQGPSTSTTYQTFGSTTQNDTQTGGSSLGPWTCYLGTETQPADPTIGEGVAYRGIAYIVFNPLNLGPGATIPPLTFEVVTEGALNGPEILWQATPDPGQPSAPTAFDDNGNVLVASGGSGTKAAVNGITRIDASNGSILQNNPLPNTRVKWAWGLANQNGAWYFQGSYTLRVFDPDSLTVSNPIYSTPVQAGAGNLIALDNYLITALNESVTVYPPYAGSIPIGGYAALTDPCTTGVGNTYYFNSNGTLNAWNLDNDSILASQGIKNLAGFCIVGETAICSWSDSSDQAWLSNLSLDTLEVVSSVKAPVALNGLAQVAGMYCGYTNSGNYISGYTGALVFLNSEGGDVGSLGFGSIDWLRVNNGYVYLSVGAEVIKVLPPNRYIIPGTLTLPAAVTILCERAGIESFDVSELPDVPVNFVRGDTVTARSMLQRLSQAYFFSMVDSGGTLRFVPWGQPSAAVIPLEDLGYDKVSPNAQTPFTASRISGVDLPRSVKIRYISAALNWEKYEQVFALESYESGKEITLDLPLILDDQTAYNIAALACCLPHAERMQYSFATSYKWLALEPGDVVTLPFGTCRILTVKMGQKNGIPVIDFTACIDGINSLAGTGYATPALPNYQPNAGGITALLAAPTNLATTQTPGSPSPHPIATAPQMVQTVPNAGVPKMVLVEPPPLTASDTGMRFMAGAYSTGNVFPGAAIFQSSDGGNTYTQMSTEISATVAGYANTVLPVPSGPYNQNNSYTWDNFSTVDVYLLGSNGGTLSPTTDLQVLNGANGAMLGSELIQYANATLMTDSLGNPFYRLSRLLRGRKGTEWAMGTHQVGEPFYAIPSALGKEPYTPPMLNNAYLYKVVMMGGDLSNAPAKSYEPSGASVMQWAPCDVLTSKDGAGDWTVSWTPRARYNGDWASGYISSLDQDTTGWSIDIMSGTTVKRTIQVPLQQTGPWQTVYTAAMQSADGFSPGQTGIAFNLYQLSQSVGRGYPASGSTGAAPSEI